MAHLVLVRSTFYRKVVGLEFAYRDPVRDVLFLGIGLDKRSVLGLCGPDTVHGREPSKCHFAIAMSLPELLAAVDRLSATSWSPPTSLAKR